MSDDKAKKVAVNLRIDFGCKLVLLELAEKHRAFSGKKTKKPSIQKLFRMMASGQIQTTDGIDVIELEEYHPMNYGKEKSK